MSHPASRVRHLRWVLLVVGGALLALLVLKIGPRQMLDAWRHASKLPVLAASLLFAATIALRAVKWRLFLSNTNYPVGYRACLQAYCLNTFFANLTPARSGEMLAPVWLARHGVPTSTGVAVLIVDRTLDLLAVLTLFFLAAWNLSRLTPDDSAAYRTAGVVVSLLVGVALVLFVLALLRLSVAIDLAGRLPGRLGARLTAALTAFRDALVPFGHRRTLFANLGLTFAGWLMDMLSSFILVRAFLPGLTFLESATAAMFACLAAIFSFIPGGIGIGAASYTAILALLGYDPYLAGSAAVLWTIVAHAVRAGLAGVFYHQGNARR